MTVRPEPSQPFIFFSIAFVFETKKGESEFLGARCYGRFLIAISSTTPTMAIAIIIAIPTPTMYISVGGKLTVGYGDAVGAGMAALKCVSAFDG